MSKPFTGRPTLYTDDMLVKAQDYIDNCPDVVHTVVGLCLYIGVAKSTAYRWAEEGNAVFKDILDTVSEKQEQKLIGSGLINEFNSAITKMMLTKHGYTDKTETVNTNIDLTHEQWLDTLE